ncbi:uncharacterized protein LOC109910527 [Rhincodon typus]|uniref:uncharacterized protein LOC109910527 n=1 Tax=Rhincodon typus TaxID=259920 RepID=UPI002030DCE0|nr:uncharacterized protein LOC109910527 [Rhincodon typus]XP_048475921.1 uncharacterized protein LOC109910527 [Rhincodon typus]
MEDTDNAVVEADLRVSDCVVANYATPSRDSCSPPKTGASLNSACNREEEGLWSCEPAMGEGSDQHSGSRGNQSWDCPESTSSDSDDYISDFDNMLSDEELTGEHDYLRSLLQIIGEPPPFQYYREFENAMNSPGIKSSFSYLHTEGEGETVHDRFSPLSSDRDKSSSFNNVGDAGTSSSGNVSQYRKVTHSGVVAPFSNRTLSHPSFHSFYAAVSSQQSQSFLAELDDSRFKNKDSTDSHSKPDLTIKSEASILRSQEIHMPAIHQCEFFYTDPMLPSGYRVYNHLSLPTRQVLQGLRLNTPSPIMSASVAPPSVQRDNCTPVSHASHSLDRCQEQNRPVSKAECDAISTLLDLSQFEHIDNTRTGTMHCTPKNKCVHQSEDHEDVGTDGVKLPPNPGDSSIKDCADPKQKHHLFLNNWSKTSMESSPTTELYKIKHLAEPKCEHSPGHLKYTDSTKASTKSEGRPSITSSDTKIRTEKSLCIGREPVDFGTMPTEVAQENEVSSCDFPT